MTYAVKVLADSVSPAGHRLTTMEITFPRFILAELNTHRMLSRNSASSRAIPVTKRIEAIRRDGPYMPEVFTRNKPGMQGGEELDGPDGTAAAVAWVEAAAYAVVGAEKLAKAGVHKQYANRLLEPFLWHTCVVSATEWDNFFHLRDHTDAQPEFQRIARMMREAMDAHQPIRVPYGGWHRPYIRPEDLNDPKYGHDWESLAMISTARCARVSYLTHDGRRDTDADVNLGLKLMASGHMSPFEHVALCVGREAVHSHYGKFTDPNGRYGNFVGWMQWRKMIPMEHDRLKPMTITES